MNAQKWSSLAIYAVLAALALLNPGSGLATGIGWLFAVLVVAHLVEFVAFNGVMRKAGGSMANHFLQTFLFGFMHWRPLQQQQATSEPVE